MKFNLVKTFLILSLASTFLYASVTVDDIQNNLMCQCGCSMALYSCQCDTASKMRSKIQSMIDQGKNKDQILASFVSNYGEKVLSAPTKSGFNLMAWVTPFLAIGIAGSVLFVAVKKWSSNTEAVRTVANDVQSEYSQRLKNELDNFDEGDYV